MHGLCSRSRQQKLNCQDMAQDSCLKLVQFVPDEFQVLFGRDWHHGRSVVVSRLDSTEPTARSQLGHPPQHPIPFWRALVRQLTRLEDSLIGDALGVLFLFASLWGFLWLAPVVEELLK
ncbi:hypothetical protein [Cereibacter azotoformans]|uniref:Uncharacterized protein n=1 Tax=Cereibacter azotoformans TaxID=43057 RepID=A0A2T5JSH0_9RHOB|nr:hypothetical protein [Cereibacter azotoformans]MBO4168908.1 hypothetical protein [Cereibacter azotoformans]PTR11184.1 hypothetical protein C8J28_12845 [Cereibacter azotoformans]